MKFFLFAILTLVAMAFLFVPTAMAATGNVSSAAGNHRWTQEDVGAGKTSVHGGTTVTNTGTGASAPTILFRWCPGDEHHDPHEEVTFRSGAHGTASGLGTSDTVNLNGSNTATIGGNGATVNVNGNNGTEIINGDGNHIVFGQSTVANHMTVNGNNNDIDLNGSGGGSNGNSVTTNGNGNNIHN